MLHRLTPRLPAGWSRHLRAWRRRLLPRHPCLEFVPPGHYYSPLTDFGEWRAHPERYLDPEARFWGGIDFQPEEQRAALARVAAAADPLRQERLRRPGPHRYRTPNGLFSASDAWCLQGWALAHRPSRIVEVGAGWSTAALLDAIDFQPGYQPSYTCIEPEPARLQNLLRPADSGRLELLACTLQDAPLQPFDRLQAGDLLFVDSSHVVRPGNDLCRLAFEILPRLAAGVTVHFHDIYYPLSYPREWIEEGRAYNESLLVRALLQFSAGLHVRLFPAWLRHHETPVSLQAYPGLLEEPGCSLYLARVDPAAGWKRS